MKTIEEAADLHMKEPHQLFTRSKNSFKAGAKFAQRWIPVKEELPEVKDEPYYIIFKDRMNEPNLLEICHNADISYLKRIAISWRKLELK